jgi:hypothetical protein
MKKIVILAFIMIVAAFSIHSLDSEKAKKAVSEGEYIPALMDYGFTEQQIRSWSTSVGITIRDYLTDLKRNGRYARGRTLATMELQMAVRNREITENDRTKIDLFLEDIEAFWKNELSREEEAAKQRAQAAEAQRAQERARVVQEQRQYAKSFGLDDCWDGIYDLLINITPENFERAKRRMIIPENPDQAFSVQSVVDGYVIYSMIIGGRVHQVALKAERGKTYPANGQIDVNSVYKIEETRRFARAIGGTIDIIVISRLGPRR